MKFLTSSFLLIALLYGMVFAIGDAILSHGQAPIWMWLVFPVVIISLQFAISPSIIRWVLDIDFDESVIPDAQRVFVDNLCRQRNIPRPRLGIIESGTPNAFSFGRFRSDACVVVTRGLLDRLTSDEANAVLSHEVGHIEHYDFAVMAIATLAPLLLYQLYVWTRGNKNTRAVAIAAYACYIVGQYIVLMLNRTREYWADHYCSEVTREPNQLSSALVKIAYGLVKADGDYRESLQTGVDKDARKSAAKLHHAGNMISMMGIANVQSGASLALGMADPQHAAAVMRWDLVNPWSRVYQLGSTHPLTALRIQALNEDACRLGETTEYPLPDRRRIEWGNFPLEFLIWSAPFFCGAALVFDVALIRYASFLHISLPARVNAWLFILLGVSWMARIAWRYRGIFAPSNIETLLADTGVSQMTPRAIQLEGEIIGNGVPGAFWSPDLVLRDKTGMIFVLYRSSIPFARLLFAIKDAYRFIGEQATVRGWYRRGLRPYIELSEIRATVTRVAPGRGPTTLFGSSSTDARLEPEALVQRSYSRWIQFAGAALATAIGCIWLLN